MLRLGWVLSSGSVAGMEVIAQSLELPGGRWERAVVFFGGGISVFLNQFHFHSTMAGWTSTQAASGAQD